MDTWPSLWLLAAHFKLWDRRVNLKLTKGQLRCLYWDVPWGEIGIMGPIT